MLKAYKHPHSLLVFIAIVVNTHITPLKAQPPDDKKNDTHDSLLISGKASYYANMLQGLNTSSGDTYDKNDFTCAHRTLPFNTILCVTNTSNGKNAIVRVNDRGPYRKGRVIDLSRAAAKKLGMVPNGVVKVNVQELILRDSLPFNDSLLHNGNVIDAHGSFKQLKGRRINVWETTYLKHAYCMAANLENAYSPDSVFIKVSGEGEGRKYILYISDIPNKEEADKLLSALKQDGFSLCRYEKN